MDIGIGKLLSGFGGASEQELKNYATAFCFEDLQTVSLMTTSPNNIVIATSEYIIPKKGQSVFFKNVHKKSWRTDSGEKIKKEIYEGERFEFSPSGLLELGLSWMHVVYVAAKDNIQSAASRQQEADFACKPDLYACYRYLLCVLNSGDSSKTKYDPMTLEYHMKEMPWAKILQEAIRLGYTSHQANTCGLHVHVNRDAFGESETEQDAVIARILYFFEKNWEELLKFSRRTPRQLERWATRYGYKDQPKELLDHAKKGYHGGRYTSVNLTNTDTIEFRIFRGTLKYNTLIATLQLLDRICDVAICLTDDQVKAMSWTTFASGCTQPELVRYLKERRLYVNDPVESEEEV